MFSLFFQSFKTLIVGKTRLFIEYLLIGFVVILAGFTFTLWWQKDKIETKLETVEQTVSVLQSANEVNVKTIDSLMVLRNNDAAAIDGLIKGYKSLAQKSDLVKNKLKELEQNNDEIRTFLHSPLPAAIKCLLNKTCKTDSSDEINLPNSSGAINGIVQPAKRTDF